MAVTRRSFLACLCASRALLPGVLNTVDMSVRRRPNVLFILADDLGYGDLSCCGADDLKTPKIDALFSRGKRFDRFYANCPVCSPTRASLLTGRYPNLVGVPGVIRTRATDSYGYLAPHAVLLPELLRKNGYSTALVGKWHLGLESPNVPTERGFDFFHGFLGDMMDDYYHHRRHNINYMRLNETEIDPPGHATDLFTDWTIDYIRQHARTNKPFFLYLAYNAPHTPIQPPVEWLERVRKRETGVGDKRAKLVALIEHMDDGIGRVLTALRQNGMEDNTLILFTSDNGGQINAGAKNGELKGGKQEMWEGGIRVPMCAVWLGKIDAGTTDNRIAMTMDLFPTICEAAGVNIEYEIDGRSILPALRGFAQEEEDRLLFWVRREGHRYRGRDYYAARSGKWKLVQNTPFEPYRLYDIENDPGENFPLDESLPVFTELERALRNFIIKAGAIPWQKSQ